MLRIRIDPDRPDAAEIEVAARALGGGGIVAFPTETFYGLAVDPRSASAVEALFSVKGRPAGQSIPLIAADLEQVLACTGPLERLAMRLAVALWPGPLTMVTSVWSGLSPSLLGGGSTVAVRVPGLAAARALAKAFGHPVTSTSANPSGRPATTEGDAVAAALGNRLDVLLDGGSTRGGLPSTIVDVTGGQPRLVRAGAVAWERVLECLRTGP